MFSILLNDILNAISNASKQKNGGCYKCRDIVTNVNFNEFGNVEKKHRFQFQKNYFNA